MRGLEGDSGKRCAPVAVAMVAAIALVAAACGGGEDGTLDPAPQPAAVASAANGEALPADTFDRAFIDAMVPHHEAAIEMARAAREAGLVVAELNDIADAVIATQQAEIDQMKEWREQWFGTSEIDPAGAAALGLSESEMGMQHGSGGFSTADDVDQAFAAAMIDHHNGAIAMAQLALESSERPEIRDLAERIIEAQRREVEVMGPHASGAMQHG